MEIQQKHIDHISQSFQEMQEKKDLLVLMNYVKPLLFGKNSKPFKLSQLTYYSNLSINNKRYKSFSILKKSGGKRQINAPVKDLKSIQKVLSLILQVIFSPHEAANGFVSGKSIVDNAKVHVGNYYVYNIDLKDFFQTIDQARVWKCLQLEPFCLNKKTSTADSEKKLSTGLRIATTTHNEKLFYKFKNDKFIFYPKLGEFKDFENRISSSFDSEINNENQKEEFKKNFLKEIFSEENKKQLSKIKFYDRLDLAGMITNLCCNKQLVERIDNKGDIVSIKKGVLPQGAPTSPVLTNVVCQRLDYLLTGVAKRFGLKYSRYADDITFSSLHNVYQKNSKFIIELERIIENQGFIINKSKTRLQKTGYKQEVTGLTVNKKVNVNKRYVKQIRMWLYYWEKYGYDKAEKIFRRDYLKDKGHIKNIKNKFENVIDGKLEYMKMVKGDSDGTYRKLKERLDKLNSYHNPINKILNTWEDYGINSAIKIYKVKAMNKYNFVKDLLENEKFDSFHNERLIKLIFQEIVNDESTNSELWNEINMIKSEIGKDIESAIEIDKEKEDKNKNHLPYFHKPVKLIKLLNKFSENGSALKYTAHSWEMGKSEKVFDSYEDFIMKVNTQFKTISWDLKNLNEKLQAKIYSFLINKNVGDSGWGKHRIKYGWSHPHLKKIMHENPRTEPSKVQLPESSRMTITSFNKRETIQNLGQVISIFKNEIKIREEGDIFKRFIMYSHKTNLNNDFKISFMENLEGVSFYTDVDYLGKAIKCIHDGISSRAQHPDIGYKITDETDYYLFEIIHIESFSNKSFKDSKFQLTSGDFGTLSYLLKNLCDWSIINDFKEGLHRLNFLTSDDSINFSEELELKNKPKGFTHQLKFYKI